MQASVLDPLLLAASIGLKDPKKQRPGDEELVAAGCTAAELAAAEVVVGVASASDLRKRGRWTCCAFISLVSVLCSYMTQLHMHPCEHLHIYRYRHMRLYNGNSVPVRANSDFSRDTRVHKAHQRVTLVHPASPNCCSPAAVCPASGHILHSTLPYSIIYCVCIALSHCGNPHATWPRNLAQSETQDFNHNLAMLKLDASEDVSTWKGDDLEPEVAVSRGRGRSSAQKRNDDAKRGLFGFWCHALILLSLHLIVLLRALSAQRERAEASGGG